MLTSLFTAVSGMNANGTALSVIGDNVANMNTHGFKASRAYFGDILSQSLGTSQIGRGVAVSSVKPTFTQGTFENSTSVLDLAIGGDGLFIVSDANGTFYTRAGQFALDKDGNIVNPNGLRLQGYLFSATSLSSAPVINSIGDINLSTLNSPPNPTTTVEISANLDSRQSVPAAFDVTNPNNTSNFSTSITVYDSLGNAHVVNVYFRKDTEATTGNTWEWFAVVDASASLSGSTEIQAQGTLDFDNNGALDVESALTYPLASGGFDFAGGAASGQAIDFNFGTSITTDGGTGLDGTTQFGSSSATIFQNQDGYSSGSLRSINIDQDGTITGIFTNGQTRAIGQIALAKFVSPTELTKMGKNLFAESSGSGQPIITAPGTSGTGQVLSSTLELSNVDLAEEFVKMIISQRGYQANSRIVSKSDELMAELVNLTR
ncbi:MAG: flagellar hook protein FlgE [Nitrospiraceae bacterium]|nr:MAG: flagellar hook protein FlgE [Nitrospiraceae bacterium]